VTHKDRIAEYISRNPQGVDDTDITIALRITNHATTNQNCRQLVSEGYVERRYKNGTLHNFWLGRPYEKQQKQVETGVEMSKEEYHKQWYWEGNVQGTLVKYLIENGYQIIQAVNTGTHQRGIDVIAEKSNKMMWVTVKGYPRWKVSTNPRLQCVHWFSSALYDIIKYREKSNQIDLSIALPNFERYKNFAMEITWFKKVSNLSIFWIEENGLVRKD
jgi:hypothetical protein